MTTIPKDLTSIFLTPIPYSMSTGSFGWIGIKIDFENFNDEIVGIIFTIDQGKVIEKNKLEDARSKANNFKNITFEYEPKDYDESKEQDLLLEKVNEGLAIYNWIWDRIN